MSALATDLDYSQACVLQALLLAAGYGEVSRLTSAHTGRPDGMVGPGTLAALEESRAALGTGGEAGTVDANLITALVQGPSS